MHGNMEAKAGPGSASDCPGESRSRLQSEAKNRQIIDDVISQHANTPIRIESVVEATNKKPTLNNPPDNDDMQTISNIFGNAEVLDS